MTSSRLDQAGDRHVAVVVVEGGDQPGEQGRGVQHGPAEHAGVDGVVQDLDLDGAVDQAAEAGGERGDADLPVAGVGHDDHIGAQQFPVGFQERAERRGAGFLLPLEEEGDAEAQIVAQHAGHGLVGGDVRQDPGFVVGRAAAVQPPVALDGGERLRLPQRQVAGGLHVVVRVQQDGRLARGGGTAGDDGRAAGRAVLLVAAQDPDIVETAGTHQLGRRRRRWRSAGRGRSWARRCPGWRRVPSVGRSWCRTIR